MNLKLSLLFIVLFLYTKAFSATFIVTSNADSGPGSLREAVLKAEANGIATKDYIYFNLPGNTEADRTITLLSPLTFITSNLIIDATTQPGAALGISKSKIILTVDREKFNAYNYDNSALFYLQNVDDVEIYGFYFTGLYNLKGPGGVSGAIGRGVYVSSSRNVTIGAPEKGNIFSYNENAIIVNNRFISTIQSKNIKIQSNWIGLKPDGDIYYSNSFIASGILFTALDSQIGGATKEEGNIFNGTFTAISFGGSNLNISNNRFGIDAHDNPGNEVSKLINHAGATGLVVQNNVSNTLSLELLGIRNFKILGNKDMISANWFGSNIFMQSCEDGIIGSDRVEDINVLRLNLQGIFSAGGKNIEIRRNSIVCTQTAYSTQNTDIPIIEVLVNNDTEYSGTASPGSEVYIYNDNTSCEVCNPVTFYTKVTADAAGQWKITGTFSTNRFIANTTLIHASSEYTQPKINSNPNEYVIVNPSCGLNNGTLKLSGTRHVLSVTWYNNRDEKVAEGFEVTGLAAGKYYAKAFNGKCYVRAGLITLSNTQPVFNVQNLEVKQPECGSDNGSIKGILVSSGSPGALSYKWTNERNVVVSTQSEATGLSPGTYLLTVTNAENCSKSYGPIVLNLQVSATIDLSTAVITGSSCNTSSGSIKNVTVSGLGLLSYTWRNEAKAVVGNSADLINVPAGKYILELKDEGQCAAVGSAGIDIPELNGISIDESNVAIIKVKCNRSDGGITGLTVTGASDYKWINQSGQVVGRDLILSNVPVGKYHLLAENAANCSKESQIYEVVQEPATLFNLSTTASQSSYCNKPDGLISVAANGLQPVAFRWVNSAGETVSNTATVTGVGGKYSLYLTDGNNCESFYREFSIFSITGAVADRSLERIINDQCGQHLGSIKAPGLSGGSPPYFYSWRDENGIEIGTNSTLNNIGAGTYYLTVSDGLTCSTQSFDYVVTDNSQDFPTPGLKDLRLCNPGNALIEVFSPTPGNYLLYDEQGTLLQESATGKFSVTVKATTSYFVEQRTGLCISERAPVKVFVNDAIPNIANAFSPNGDGINDIWLLTGASDFPNARIEIFNRYGQKVFESIGYKHPFDGRKDGKELPVGTYYYLIDLKTGCEMRKGSLTLIR